MSRQAGDYSSKRRYWLGQLLGWGVLHALLALQSLQAILTGQESLARVLLLSPLTWLACIVGSHMLYIWAKREAILPQHFRNYWRQLLPRLLYLAVSMALVFWILQVATDVLLPPPTTRSPYLTRVLGSFPLFLLNFSLVNVLLLALWWACFSLLSRIVAMPAPAASSTEAGQASLDADSPVLVTDGKASRLITPCHIEYVRSEGNYVKLRGEGLDILIRATLSHLEQRLARARFFRINRQTLVNLGKVKAVEEAVSGNYLLVLESGVEIEASRRQGRQLKQELSL